MIKRALITGVGKKYTECQSKMTGLNEFFDFVELKLDVDLSLLADRKLKNPEPWESFEHIDDNGESPLPTRDNIMKTINEIINNPGGTDLFLFYFSGHGLQIDKDHYCLVNYDVKYFNSPLLKGDTGGLISNKDYGDLVNDILSNHTNLIFVTLIDACFSEGMVIELNKSVFSNRHISFCSTDRNTGTPANKFTSAFCATSFNSSWLEQKNSIIGKLMGEPNPVIILPATIANLKTNI